MMSAVKKLKSVGCCIDDFVSFNVPMMAELLSSDVSEYVVFPGFCDVHVHFR